MIADMFTTSEAGVVELGEPFRVLVTGSIHVSDKDAERVRSDLSSVCARALAAGRPVVVVHGKHPRGGVDAVAQAWAAATDGVTDEPYPADRVFYGASAESRRNAHMVMLGAHMCLAYPSAGADKVWDCVQKAARCGIPVRVQWIGPKDPPFFGPRRKRD